MASEALRRGRCDTPAALGRSGDVAEVKEQVMQMGRPCGRPVECRSRRSSSRGSE